MRVETEVEVEAEMEVEVWGSLGAVWPAPKQQQQQLAVTQETGSCLHCIQVPTVPAHGAQLSYPSDGCAVRARLFSSCTLHRSALAADLLRDALGE